MECPTRFPPPRIAGDAQALAVHDALEAILRRDTPRFRRLFLFGEPLELQEPERPWMAILEQTGYVLLDGDTVSPCVRVFFLDDLLIATDLFSHHVEDRVFSLTLEQVFLVRSMAIRPGDHVLELCVGSGVNALAAGRRGAARVVGVDVSPRALEFAAANALVNLQPIELLEGNLFEPLSGNDRFDLILVNPPFEPVPPGARHFLHSHGGEDGLDVVRALLSGVADRLRPAGRFEMYTWTPGDQRTERVTELVAQILPGFRIEVRRVDGLPLEARVDVFSRHPGYDAWRDRFISAGVTHMWGVHIRAERDVRPAIVRVDAREDVRACDLTLALWE